jgi:microcystin-dependent protein
MTGYIGSNAATYIDVTPRLPTGVIVMWSGAISAIPSGWYLCDGNNGTPNLTGKFVVHADADSGGTYAPNATGGVDSVTLTTAQIPAHSHPVTESGHTHTVQAPIPSGDEGAGDRGFSNIINNNGTFETLTTSSATTGISVGNNTGGGGSHENRPPYYALAYIMKG